MATTTTADAAAAAPITIADKLEMSLDDLTKLHKKEKRQKHVEERKKHAEARKIEAAAKKAAAPPPTGAGKKSPAPKQEQKKQSSSTAGGAANGYKPQNAKKAAGAPAATTQASDKPPITTGTPVIVANLKEEIDLDQLKEIFQTVGPLKSAERLKYNGKSHAARVVYKLKADAEKAVNEFNGRLLDETPMRVTMSRKRIQIGDSKPSANKAAPTQQASQPQKRQRKSAGA
jgi:hypothetical protein